MGLLSRTVSWVLLVGIVPVAMLVAMGALVSFNVFAFTESPVTAVKIAIGVVPTVLVLGRGLWVLASKIDNPLHGVPVREHEQPELWALVRRLAEVAGTAPPDDIHLVADANAAVMEDTRMLGLISTRRHMFIGAPLVAELSSAQFAAMRAAAVHALGEAAADNGNWLGAWRAAGTGDDRHIAVVDAHGLFWLAWKLRGNKPPDQTTAEQHEAFYRLLPQCEAAARKATELAPDDPTPWCTLVTLARGHGYDNGTFTAIWRQLQARDPLHRAGHEFALMYLADESDSPQPMFAFAERAAAASAALAFLVVQAAYHAEDDDEKIWKDARVHRALDVVLRRLASPAGGGGVYANNDRRWAAYGLVSADRGAEAVPLFTQLAIDASGRPWEDFGDNAIDAFDSFRRRACAAPRSA